MFIEGTFSDSLAEALAEKELLFSVEPTGGGCEQMAGFDSAEGYVISDGNADLPDGGADLDGVVIMVYSVDEDGLQQEGEGDSLFIGHACVQTAAEEIAAWIARHKH